MRSNRRVMPSDDTSPIPIEWAEPAFAFAISDATHTVTESADAPDRPAVLLPTGVRTRRVFVVGPLGLRTSIDGSTDAWRGRLEGPSGSLFVRAGRFEPSAANEFQALAAVTLVACTGTPRISRGDSGTKYVGVHRYHVQPVDRRTWCRWLDRTANRTLERIEALEIGGTYDVTLAREQYGNDVQKYRDAVDIAREHVAQEASGGVNWREPNWHYAV